MRLRRQTVGLFFQKSSKNSLISAWLFSLSASGRLMLLAATGAVTDELQEKPERWSQGCFYSFPSCVVGAIVSGWSLDIKPHVLRASRLSLHSCACNWLLSERSTGAEAVRGGDRAEMEGVDLFFTLNCNHIHKAIWCQSETPPPPPSRGFFNIFFICMCPIRFPRNFC